MLVRALMFNGNMPQQTRPGDLIAGGESLTAGALATAGAGTITAAMIATGIIRRTGPVGAYIDTTDTADNIIAALAGNNSAADVAPGTSFRMLFINTVAQAMTLAYGLGCEVGTGTVDVAASLVREYLVTIKNATRQVVLNCGTTNASKAVTFSFQAGTGQTVWPVGTVTPGMLMSGTGVTAGTKVAGVTYGVGGITGVTTDTNLTATNDPMALTFSPNIMFDGIRAGTL